MLSQDIRLVCDSDGPAAAGCSHLYQNNGAVGKLVRLPENVRETSCFVCAVFHTLRRKCGKNAFARVANAWIPADQSIPSSIAARIVRRDGTQPQVKALSLDTNFTAIDASK